MRRTLQGCHKDIIKIFVGRAPHYHWWKGCTIAIGAEGIPVAYCKKYYMDNIDIVMIL